MESKLIAKLASFIKGDNGAQKLELYIGGIPIGKAHPCFFVAEIGINHNGSLEIAKKLIDAAAEAGAQAVKFQKRTVSAVYSAEELAKPRAVDQAVLENAVKRNVLSKESVERLVRSDFKESTNGDLKLALEFTQNEYQEIFDYANKKSLLCFASPWDTESVDFLEKLNPPAYKIASAMITYRELLEKVKAAGRPVIMSTGMSTMEEVKKSVEILKGVPLVLLHTVSTYPSEDKDLNLRLIAKLREEFTQIPVGYSGHEQGIANSLAAAVIGAHVIERHITLDKKMFGSDQAASLEPHEFSQLIKSVREMEAGFGDGIKRVLPAEVPILQKLRKK